MTRKTDKEILEEAAGYIDDGWVKYQEEDEYGRVCAIGALNKALFGKASCSREVEELYSDETTTAYRVLQILSEDVPYIPVMINKTDDQFVPFFTHPNNLYRLSQFNDHIETRQSQVADVFKTAAKKLANEDS